ncbi:MAG: hypothetical protein IJO92_00260 [Clostridia bacterium]|nr:hypothetical protein [Clostridia bacterium]
MKKMMATLLMAALLICCTGCTKTYSDEAPTLYITLGDQVYEQQGDVSNYSKKDLFSWSEMEMLATLVSPLDRKYTPIHTQEKVVSFRIDEKPDSMSLRYYEGEMLGKNHDDADIESLHIEPNGEKWPLQEGGNIYELCVSWENEVSSRTALYCFYVVAEE